jgi:uncharacterized cupin superfamily protein
MRAEARLEATDTGLRMAEDGWFIVNLADMGWESVPGGGIWSAFETHETRSPTLGVGVHVLHPGESPGFYHEETNQEGFLVLSGECVAIVEGEERRMGPWDFLHSPPGTRHIIVGAGDGPCALVMVGTRSPDAEILYPADPVAARHGMSVERDTTSPKEAYADRPPIVPAASPWPLEG